MRVYGPNRTSLAVAPNVARPTSGGTFSLGQTEAPQAQNAAVALRTLGGIDALIALQGVQDPGERRRRAVKYGQRPTAIFDRAPATLARILDALQRDEGVDTAQSAQCDRGVLGLRCLGLAE